MPLTRVSEALYSLILPLSLAVFISHLFFPTSLGNTFHSSELSISLSYCGKSLTTPYELPQHFFLPCRHSNHPGLEHSLPMSSPPYTKWGASFKVEPYQS